MSMKYKYVCRIFINSMCIFMFVIRDSSIKNPLQITVNTAYEYLLERKSDVKVTIGIYKENKYVTCVSVDLHLNDLSNLLKEGVK